MWVRFMDMSSGGGQKLGHSHIYLEASSEEAAAAIFEELFGRDPHNVTCNCCGSDYSISSSETIEQASGYDRGCDYATPDGGGAGMYVEDVDIIPEGFSVQESFFRRSGKSLSVGELFEKPDYLRLTADEICERIGPKLLPAWRPVDYVQMVQLGGAGDDPERVAALVEQIKNWARELDVKIVFQSKQ